MTDAQKLTIQKKPSMTLQEMVDQETQNRKILSQFIRDHMVKGIDYAPIHINKACANKYSCMNKYHFSKDNLTKAGAEKIGSLMRYRPDWVKDSETLEMAGNTKGLFAYRCDLYSKLSGELEGMGMGACSIEEKGNANSAIKIAKKRAFVDAVLATGALSDFFTQDLEDIEAVKEKELKPAEMRQRIDAGANNQNDKQTIAPANSTQSNASIITDKQYDFLKRITYDKGYTGNDIREKFHVKDIKTLTVNQASEIIKEVLKWESNAETTVDADEADRAISETQI